MGSPYASNKFKISRILYPQNNGDCLAGRLDDFLGYEHLRKARRGWQNPVVLSTIARPTSEMPIGSLPYRRSDSLRSSCLFAAGLRSWVDSTACRSFQHGFFGWPRGAWEFAGLDVAGVCRLGSLASSPSLSG